MKNEDKWVESFRERLKDYSEPLPKGLWDKIEIDLYNEKPKVLSLRRYWMPVAAAIAIMAITSLTVWLMKFNKMDTIYDSLSVVEKVQGEDRDVVTPDKSLLLIEEEKRLAYSSEKVKGKFEKIKENQSLSAHEFQSLSYEVDQGKASPERDETVGLFSEETTPEEETGRQHSHKAFDFTENREKQRQEKRLDSRSFKKNKWEQDKWNIGIVAGNIPYTSSDGLGRTVSGNVPSVSSLEALGGIPTNDRHTAYGQLFSSGRDAQYSTMNMHHKMPVTVGMSINYSLNSDWAVETGLNYTFLSSDFRSEENSYIEGEQKLHYLGIPLKIQRALWKNSRVGVYASLGGMLEKCISGVQEVAFMNTSSTLREHRSLDIDPIQWSVLANVGMQVDMTRQLALYMEPGIVYYFDDHTSISTIRKEHPFNFNLQVGLRFSVQSDNK